MTGIVSIYAFDPAWKMSKFTYYALLALQHRGQESVGITSYDGKVYIVENSGFVDSVFNDDVLNSLNGWISLGYVSSQRVSTCMLRSKTTKDITLCMYNLSNENITKRAALSITQELSIKDPVRIIEDVITKFKQPITFLALINNGEVITFRDPLGLKPLCIGAYGFDYGVIASESSAIECIGADLRSSIKPGELYIFNQYSIIRERIFNCKRKLCSFEYIYFSRPDSVIDDICIYDFRYRIGKKLAKEYLVDADVVIGVPETAIPFAIAYSQETGIPLHMGFISTGRKYRTAIKPSIIERVVGVQLKLNPIKSVIRGKKVVLIDDSMIRGTTTKNIVTMFKNRIGAKEVHVIVGSPKITQTCPFGMEVPPVDELIAANLTDEEIASLLNADSIHFLTIEKLIETFKEFEITNDEVCTGCFSGNYPTIPL